MAIIKIRTGKRGRPLELNTETYIDTIESLYSQASPKLAQLRKTSTGYRGEEILGSSTSKPDWVAESIDILMASELGRTPSVKELRDIRGTIRSLKQLKSPRAGVSARALSERVGEYYLRELERLGQDGTTFEQKQISQIKEMLNDLTPKQKQDVLFSSGYQDPRTSAKAQSTKRVMKWARRKTHRPLTESESWLYLLKRRLQDNL